MGNVLLLFHFLLYSSSDGSYFLLKEGSLIRYDSDGFNGN